MRLFISFLLGLVLIHSMPAAERPVVVCTTSMGATAARDVAGDAIVVETLMPAGTCPGQFDLGPQQARRVREASLVVRHEMQGFLDARFAAAGVPKDAIVALPFGGSFNVPGNYARFCAELADELVKRKPELADAIVPRLQAIRVQVRRLESDLRQSAGPLAGRRVVAALYQAEFLRWLGLDVVATFPPSDDPSPAALRNAIAAGRERGAAFVAGNAQNGLRTARLIATELGVPMVTLSNFPARSEEGAYGELIEANLHALLNTRK